MPIQLDLMPVEEKLPDAPAPKTMVVRYGYLYEIGEFPSDLTSKVGCGTKLVIRTDRGTEIGEMLTTTCGNGGCNKSISREKLLSYIENSGGRDYPFSEAGRVLRVATAQDLAEQSKLDEHKKAHINLARELVARHNLAMKIVDVEHLLGGERVLFYFVSEQRIDFRSMVRDLAHELHTRIELRQVGARDEARLTADYEKCGQHCCCKQFLKVLTPISMRSAKVQKATLDPTKISGRCGRLMCCLRYEDETYEELRKKLPKRNTRVRIEKGDAWVIDGQILTQLVLIQTDDGKREAVPMEMILEFDRPKPLMSDGRLMQTPNDRPPFVAEAPRPMRGGPMGGPGAPGGPARGPATAPGVRQDRPKPGAPAQPPQGDPLAAAGPTGGDLNTGAAPMGDEIDDLIADANDDPRAMGPAAGDTGGGAAQASSRSPLPMNPVPQLPVRPLPTNRGAAGAPRPPMGGAGVRPPQGASRPPQGQKGNRPGPPFPRGGPGPARGPQPNRGPDAPRPPIPQNPNSQNPGMTPSDPTSGLSKPPQASAGGPPAVDPPPPVAPETLPPAPPAPPQATSDNALPPTDSP